MFIRKINPPKLTQGSFWYFHYVGLLTLSFVGLILISSLIDDSSEVALALYQAPVQEDYGSFEQHDISLNAGLGMLQPINASYQSACSTFLTQSSENTVFLPAVAKNHNSWTDCSVSSFGTMLIRNDESIAIQPADVLIAVNDKHGVKGMAGTGSPSDYVRDEWFGKLPGWKRSFMRGTYENLTNIHDTAMIFDMQDMYECFSYGPESAHQAGDEALNPVFWVPKAEALAESVGKCLIYGPAVRDYEFLATPNGSDQINEKILADLITEVAPHVDLWMVQLGKYQPWVDGGHDDDGNPYIMDDFENWISKWVSWIKTANPDAEVWTQLGIGRLDPLQGQCIPSQPPEYILEFREALISAGVDGVWVMPAQPCQPCPSSAPPGFPCSNDPQDLEYYQQYLASFQKAIELSCGQN